MDPAELARLYDYLVNAPSRKGRYVKRTGNRIHEVLSTLNLPKDLVVTLLLDNSGSLRGRKIELLAHSSLKSASAVESIGCGVEVLGYTTKAWKGGRSREKWLVEGKPNFPGRLNDLRHVIYKSFEESMLVATQNFGLMVREGLLKENIDGEALIWAKSRLDRLDAKNKILIVVSDGAPVDDSTLSVNRDSILIDHLREVASEIEEEGSIYLVGIGIEHDLSSTYHNSIFLRQNQNLDDALIVCFEEFGNFHSKFKSKTKHKSELKP